MEPRTTADATAWTVPYTGTSTTTSWTTVVPTQPNPDPEFKIGDRVIAVKDVDANPITGMIGTVVDIMDGPARNKYGVEFDEQPEDGHNCNGHAKSCYGWYCPTNAIELYVERQYEEIDSPFGLLE